MVSSDATGQTLFRLAYLAFFATLLAGACLISGGP